MPSYIFKADEKSFESKKDPKEDKRNHPEEDVKIHGPNIAAQDNAFGIFAAPPSSANLTIDRNVLSGGDNKGELVLCKMAAESQLWNNRDGKEDQWPTAELFFDRRVGKINEQVQKIDLKRIVVDSWSLNWTGEGENGLTGSNFRESVSLRSFLVTRTSLAGGDNQSVNVRLKG